MAMKFHCDRCGDITTRAGVVLIHRGDCEPGAAYQAANSIHLCAGCLLHVQHEAKKLEPIRAALKENR